LFLRSKLRISTAKRKETRACYNTLPHAPAPAIAPKQRASGHRPPSCRAVVEFGPQNGPFLAGIEMCAAPASRIVTARRSGLPRVPFQEVGPPRRRVATRPWVAARIASLQDGQRKSASPLGEAATQQEAADLLNVGKRSVERARKLLDSETAEPELKGYRARRYLHDELDRAQRAPRITTRTS
jgi:hypothetical protein